MMYFRLRFSSLCSFRGGSNDWSPVLRPHPCILQSEILGLRILRPAIFPDMTYLSWPTTRSDLLLFGRIKLRKRTPSLRIYPSVTLRGPIRILAHNTTRTSKSERRRRNFLLRLAENPFKCCSRSKTVSYAKIKGYITAISRTENSAEELTQV